MVKELIVLFSVLLTMFVAIFSCGSSKIVSDNSHSGISDSASTFEYADVSGNFTLQRRTNLKNKKLYFQRMLYQDSFDKSVEKLRTITQVGGVIGKEGVYFRPVISQIQLWMEGKEFSNQMKLNLKSKSLDVVYTGKNKLAQKISIPIGKEHNPICFFNQLPECLRMSGMLRKFIENKNQEYEITLIMESYPFNDLLYSDFSNNALYKAKVVHGTQDMIDSKNEFVLNVEMGEQIFNLKFSRSGLFLGMFWVAQGITMVAAGSKI
ncbi:MAG: hypothetical protein QE271_07325 [Bacteriovoracaceae bacterium]|nr:hypothetical protein [Bacteriovoracaceae bacterium]